MSELNFKRRASASGEDTSVVLFLHGYGADGADLLGLAEPLAQHTRVRRYRRTRFVTKSS